jgi:hypothetical protein
MALRMNRRAALTTRTKKGKGKGQPAKSQPDKPARRRTTTPKPKDPSPKKDGKSTTGNGSISVLGELEKTLLSLGGTHVDLHDTSDAELILSRGKLVAPKQVRLSDGKGASSYEIASRDFLVFRALYRLATGYARLGESWVRHSWLQTPDGLIIEPVSKKDAYFGVVLEEEEAEQFIPRYVTPLAVKSFANA